ncbi:MAG: class I SAM-dependent methyltransferase [Chitinophagales bacterium]
MILYIIHKVPLFRKIYFNSVGRPFVSKKINPLVPLLPRGTPVLDIGSGNGLAAHLLKEKGFDIVCLDIHEGNYHPSVKPIVYDGKHIPFEDDHFESGIILTVLHHTDNPDIILKEAMRVCRSLIIMEDIYENKFQQYITYFLDSVANLFYSPCPHTNRNDNQWKKTFAEMGLELRSVHYRKVIFFIKQGIYEVAKIEGGSEK